MNTLRRGLYSARLAAGPADLMAAQALRHLAFRGETGLDQDSFDERCQHLMVEDAVGQLVACCRLQSFAAEADLSDSYAAMTYDLNRLARFPGPKLEMGRFCLHPTRHDPDILRLIWGALTTLIDQGGVTLLFGCTSFAGANPEAHQPALATLRRFVAPADHAPGPHAPERVPLPEGRGDPTGLPPLLRSYLGLGAWVSDHAVLDRDLDTLHVLTALPIDRVPAGRARALRAVAGTESNADG